MRKVKKLIFLTQTTFLTDRYDCGIFYNEFIINEDLRREKKLMKIKKLLATGLATAMAVTTLAGCGSTTDNNASQSAGTDSAAGSTQAAASMMM